MNYDARTGLFVISAIFFLFFALMMGIGTLVSVWNYMPGVLSEVISGDVLPKVIAVCLVIISIFCLPVVSLIVIVLEFFDKIYPGVYMECGFFVCNVFEFSLGFIASFLVAFLLGLSMGGEGNLNLFGLKLKFRGKR